MFQPSVALRLSSWYLPAVVAAGTLLAWVLAWQAGDNRVLPGGISIIGLLTFLLWALLAWLAARVCARAPRVSDRRRAALLAAWASACQAVATFYFSVPAMAEVGRLWGLPLADLVLFAAYVLWVLALLWPGTVQAVGRRARLLLLDLVIALAVFALLVWYYLIGPSPQYLGYKSGWALFVEALYPVCDLALLLAVVAALVGMRRQAVEAGRRLLVLVVALLFLADALLGLHLYVLRDGYLNVLALAVQQLAQCVLLAALLHWLRHPASAAASAAGLANGVAAGDGRQPDPLLSPVALWSALGLFSALIVEHLPRPLDRDTVLTMGSGVVALVILGRQMLSAFLNQRWLLAQRAELERQVAARTSELALANVELATANTGLAVLARQDALTGLANRRAFDEDLAKQWREAAERRQPLALLMIDVDAFKAYNDTLGHLAGDACLRRLAARFQTALEDQSALLARYGGEEFAVLLPGADSQAAALVAARLRSSLQAWPLAHPASPLGSFLTISVGVAEAWPATESDGKFLVAQADAALYSAKQRGRDRVEVASAGMKNFAADSGRGELSDL
jgi:diguanylate cyclase (GGDEF)-like protein